MPSTSGTSNAVLLERIEQIRSDVCETNGKLDALQKSVQESNQIATKERALLFERLDNAKSRSGDHEDRIKSMEDNLKPQLAAIASQMKLITGIIAFIGVSVGTWLVASLLHLITP